MSLVTILGGARSGKSAAAEASAHSWRGAVVYVATAEAGDDEMRDRIELHRARRPAEWLTIEEPIELGVALGKAAGALVLIDCLSLWLANIVVQAEDDDVLDLSRKVARQAAERQAPTIAVSNEVGLGVVPVSALGRRYRDLLGLVNQDWVAASTASYLAVAGRLLPLHDLAEDLHVL